MSLTSNFERGPIFQNRLRLFSSFYFTNFSQCALSFRAYFHTFEADDCQTGLNFADESEAAYFHQTVEGKLTERRQRKERRNAMKRQSSQSNNTGNNGSTSGGMGAPPPPPSMHQATPPPLNGSGVMQPTTTHQNVQSMFPMPTQKQQQFKNQQMTNKSKAKKKGDFVNIKCCTSDFTYCRFCHFLARREEETEEGGH